MQADAPPHATFPAHSRNPAATTDAIDRLRPALTQYMQTKLTLVVCRAAGHDPVRATGLLLTNLSTICDQTRPDRAQLWPLGGGRKRPPDDPWDHFSRAANKRNISPGEMRSEEWLSATDLARNPLA